MKKGSSLQGTVSKNNVLERMTNDAFDIVSSLSSSEIVVGVWVIDKEDAKKSKTFVVIGRKLLVLITQVKIMNTSLQVHGSTLS